MSTESAHYPHLRVDDDYKGHISVSLSPALSVGSYTHQYYSQGYLIYQHQGQAGKVCASGLEETLGAEQTEVFIRSLANSTCDHLGYGELAWAAITRDQEEAEVGHNTSIATIHF